MRRALSSSQMAAPGTLPCMHTHTRARANTVKHSHVDTHICTRMHMHTHNPVSPCCTPNSCWLPAPPHPSLQQPLPRHFSPACVTLLLSILFPPSSRLWQLLIHVAALQMSQLTSWENSRGGGGGLEGIGGVWFISIFDRKTHQKV